MSLQAALILPFLLFVQAGTTSSVQPVTTDSKRAAQEWLQPYVAGPENPWERRKAAHLLRRAGFGGSQADVETVYLDGLEKSLKSLLHFEEANDPIEQTLGDFSREIGDLNELKTIQSLWLYRLVRTARPFQEKMVLFWHGHFATANYKVDAPYFMHKQNELFRRMALGNFRDLLVAVSQDPAMILWLDNQTNRKGHPNENYARELFELFSLGIGNYTEKDVQEAARAFTGWHLEGYHFHFNASEHDSGKKQVLGHAGNFNGEDIVDLVAEHPATARRLASKLLRFFVLPDPEPELVDAVAEVYLQAHGDMRRVMETLLGSRLFFSERAYRSLIKSPAELVIGTIRLLDCPSERRFTLPAMRKMGQELYNPPSVKGWDGGRDWINTVTLLERQNYLRDMLMEAEVKVAGRDHILLQSAKEKNLQKPEEVVHYMVEAIVQGDMPKDSVFDLVKHFEAELAAGEKGEAGESFDYKLRRLAYLIMTSSSYQAN